ncbi:MAG: YtxH domain-containing protein [Gemmatimonadaceae bacterium]
MPHAADGHGRGRATAGASSGRSAAGGRQRSTTGDRPGRAAAERPRVSGQPRPAADRMRPADRVRGWRDTASGLAEGRWRQDSGRTDAHEHDHADEPAARQRPRGRPYSRSLELDVDWRRARTFAAGLTAGALLGAGVALLMAPQSGSRTRRQLVNVGRRAGSRAADAWDGLGDELRVARARARRDMKRGLRSGRREAVDAWSDLDRRALRGLRSIRQWRTERDREHARKRGQGRGRQRAGRG